jgi:hypothetical protein
VQQREEKQKSREMDVKAFVWRDKNPEEITWGAPE